jgi:hypothetical protein
MNGVGQGEPNPLVTAAKTADFAKNRPALPGFGVQNL